jgi:hypothetical protein
MLQIEEGDGPMLELAPDDAFGWKSEVPVERERAFQVVDPDGEHRDPWLHNTATGYRLLVRVIGYLNPRDAHLGGRGIPRGR